MTKITAGLTLTAFLWIGCGGGGGSGALDRDECRELLDQIENVMYANLTPEERATVEAEASDDTQALESCVAGETWNRNGYECVMNARSEIDLRRCVLDS